MGETAHVEVRLSEMEPVLAVLKAAEALADIAESFADVTKDQTDVPSMWELGRAVAEYRATTAALFDGKGEES